MESHGLHSFTRFLKVMFEPADLGGYLIALSCHVCWLQSDNLMVDVLLSGLDPHIVSKPSCCLW